MRTIVAHSAGALMIGSELLSGKVKDENLAPLARTLRAVGVRLVRATTIGDDVEAICSELDSLRNSVDVVFTSGGVGPTHDDVTVAAVARAFGVTTRLDESYRKLIEAAYGERCTPVHLRMALVPEGAELLTTTEVTWPTIVMKNVWVLPGLPEAFRSKLSVVHACLRGPEPFHSRALYLRAEEVELTPLLDEVVAAHPAVEIGSYPKWFEPTYKTKVTFDARSIEALEGAVAAFVARLPEPVVREE